jgi:hypothetical protein
LLTPPVAPEPMDAHDRIRTVASLLAEAIMRCRLRRILKENLVNGTRENELEVCAASSAHGERTFQKGEPK